MKNNKLVYLLIIIITIWCLALTIGQKSNNVVENNEVVNQVNVTGFSTDFTKVVDENKDAVVTVNSDGKLSSGFVYKQSENDLFILCSYHGVADGINNTVYFSNGYKENAEVFGYNAYLDLAVLRINTPYNINQLSVGDSELLNVGEFVICIGTPKSIDYEQTVELAMISNNIRTIENSITVDEQNISYYMDVIQLSSDLKEGYSGSPVINMNGEVVGMITMSDDGIVFATTINEIKIVADKIINEESYKKYQLGINGTYVEDMQLFERSSLNLNVDTIYGIYVNKVKENSFVYASGIRQGDVITKINNIEIHNRMDYLEVVYSDTTDFEFNVIRNGESLTIKASIND